jgi:hypothetical protein
LAYYARGTATTNATIPKQHAIKHETPLPSIDQCHVTPQQPPVQSMFYVLSESQDHPADVDRVAVKFPSANF